MLQIPRRLFFEAVDSAREGLLYLGKIPSGNCYVDDVEIHLAVWEKKASRYLAIYKLRSVTSHGKCGIFIEAEDQNDFVSEYNRYRSFLTTTKAINRNYTFAARDDAFSNIEKSRSQKQLQSSGSQSLSVSFVADANYTRCMDSDLTKVTKRHS